ncbi:MAG: hypothetical protein VXW32_02930, partial [Myxococcota bacterium]|nr:hypothetical protein [Myxococcota bacterium]
ADISYADDVESLIVKECGSSCHGRNKTFPNLANGDGYDAIVSVKSNQSSLMLVEPNDHTRSYLWHKINGSHSTDGGGKGDQMPDNNSCCFTQMELDLVADWIDGGALR